MLPELSLFIQHAIAQANVQPPQTIESLTNSRSRSVNDDLALSIREVS